MASTFLDARVAAPAGLDSRVSAPVPARTPPLLHTRCRANCSRAHLALCACYRRGRHYRELHYAPRRVGDRRWRTRWRFSHAWPRPVL